MDAVVVVGLVLAAGFWIMTQVNIIWTKNALSKRVITASAETKQQAIDTVVGMEKRLDSQVAKVETMVASLPSADDLGIDYDELAEHVGPAIGQYVTMAFNQVKAQETKALQAQLEQLGVGEVIDEAKAMALDQLPPQMVQAQRILGMKVSKKYASEHPIEAQAIEMGKLYIMQMLEGQLGGLGIGPKEGSRASAESGGIGVRAR